jgi:hypothetical protein
MTALDGASGGRRRTVVHGLLDPLGDPRSILLRDERAYIGLRIQRVTDALLLRGRD